jgi:hypothetical protein
MIGKLTHTEAGNVIAMSPAAQGEETPVEWRTAKPTCDHCHTARRRNETFIVRCPDGSVKRVGRNCLADFLAGDPAQFLAADAFDDILRQAESGWDDDFGGFGGFEWSVTTVRFVACATQTTRKDGFLKRGSEGQCTSDRARMLASRNPGGRSEQDWKDNQPTADDTTRAEMAIKWAIESTESSDYAHNLRIAVSSAVADTRFLGLLASLPQAYNRAMGEVVERAAKPVAGHFGEVGKRVDAEVTVERVKAYESMYGVKRMVAMRTDAGNVLITFTTGQGCSSQDVGKRFTIRGTVKRHGEYQGAAQTELSRVTFKEV